jgi:large subunit ribosomal protein L25
MIKDITLNASPRDGVGKGFARRLRMRGLIPAAVYGEDNNPVAVSVNAKEIAAILRSDTGHNTIFKLAVAGATGDEPSNVIIKDWQVDPVKGRLLHADLLRLSMTSVTRVSVSVVTIGEPIGVKIDGGILELQQREMEVECLPGDIPENLTVDVSNLQIGDHVTIADLVYDRDRVRVLAVDENQIVAGVLAPRMVEEVAKPEGVEVAPTGEPEVIKKGKGDEE